jgi:hypothetical protein
MVAIELTEGTQEIPGVGQVVDLADLLAAAIGLAANAHSYSGYQNVAQPLHRGKYYDPTAVNNTSASDANDNAQDKPADDAAAGGNNAQKPDYPANGNRPDNSSDGKDGASEGPVPRATRGSQPVEPDPAAEGNPHTRIGTQPGDPDGRYPHGPYRQGFTFDENGELTGRTDVTDHGRPWNHDNPHFHPWGGPNGGWGPGQPMGG